MALMIKRMAGELHLSARSWSAAVRSSELIADLSWDTREPSENHVKQRWSAASAARRSSPEIGT
jgi:hypothetical protein